MFHPENNPGLFQAFRRGDHAAFEKYYDLHFASVCGFLDYLVQDKVVAEDLAIQAFCKLYNNRSRINDEVHLRAFLLVAARNLFREHFRAQAHDRQLKHHLSRQPEYESPVFKSEHDGSEVIKDLELSLSGLTERRRTVLELHYFQGLSIKDIARRLSLSEHTINNTLAQTLKILRGELFERWGQKNPALS